MRWVTEDEGIGPQITALGFSPDDIRWVIMTHLHTDHAGGLSHFPTMRFVLEKGPQSMFFIESVNRHMTGHWCTCRRTTPRRQAVSLNGRSLDGRPAIADAPIPRGTRGRIGGHLSEARSSTRVFSPGRAS
jgi:glyoxylase-like metal-dependent hydrolase (beta-lactamase superfamily II)